jgi:uncharacterized protein YerC
LFAQDVPNANVEALQQVIIDSKNIKECYFFARDVKTSNKQLLSEIVLASGDLYYINLFYNNINFDKTKYNNLILFI